MQSWIYEYIICSNAFRFDYFIFSRCVSKFIPSPCLVLLNSSLRYLRPRGQGSHVPPHGPYCLVPRGPGLILGIFPPCTIWLEDGLEPHMDWKCQD